MKRTAAGLFALLIGLGAVQAGAADVPGSSDHPLVGRYEGSTITFHETRGYEELRLPDRQVPRGRQRNPEEWTAEEAGRVTQIRYEGPGGRTALEIMRNYQTALEGAGFATAFFCRGEGQCTERGSMSAFWDAARAGIGLPTNWDTGTYLLAVRDDAAGRVSVAVFSVEVKARGSEPLRAVTAVTVVEGEPIELDRIAFVEASAMEAAFASDGRVAVYGITFDVDSAVLRPEALPQVAELGRLLAENPALRVVIVGHTDSTGSFEHNLGLSQRRAQSVVEALVAGHGIEAGRLTPAGAGMLSPVATNRTEEGRALNRRVEIVEIVR